MFYLNRLRPVQYVAIIFLLVILIGSLILFLPLTHLEGKEVTYMDALFTSISAVCVTGLVVVDISEHFNLFGRIVDCHANSNWWIRGDVSRSDVYFNCSTKIWCISAIIINGRDEL